MKPIHEMTLKEQEEILKVANEIRKSRENDKKFTSLSKSKSIMIRWDASYKDFGSSYFSVNVSYDEVADLVKGKIFGDDDENQ